MERGVRSPWRHSSATKSKEGEGDGADEAGEEGEEEEEEKKKKKKSSKGSKKRGGCI